MLFCIPYVAIKRRKRVFCGSRPTLLVSTVFELYPSSLNKTEDGDKENHMELWIDLTYKQVKKFYLK